MNKTKKLLSVLLAVIMALSCMSVMASAAKTNYKTVADLEALDAYSPYGQVTRLSTEARMSMVFDFLDNTLAPMTNLNMGYVVNVNLVLTKIQLYVNITSVDEICKTLDSAKALLEGGLVSMLSGSLGVLGDLDLSGWPSGLSRSGAQLDIVKGLLAVLGDSDNGNAIYDILSTGNLDLGMVGGLLGGSLDLSAVTGLIGDLPGLIKGLVFPLLERWDDDLTLIKKYDTNSKGNGNVKATINERVQKLFNDNMSITTVKYDETGKMTSEHEGMPFRTTAPGTPAATDPRCVYVINGTTPGSTMTIYHIVDAKEAEDRAKDTDPENDATVYTYVAQEETYVLSEEVEGNGVYVWKAEMSDDLGNTWTDTLKWYNDDSQFLPGFNGDDIDLTTMSAGELLYTFIPTVFKNLATVVLNGSMKKILAELFGAKFTFVGKAGPDGDDAVLDLGNDAIFAGPQGDYVFEWSDYAIVDGTHYYRYLDDLYVADLSATNNYFDIINFNYEITDDFMNEFIPENDDNAGTRLLLNLNNFLIKVAETVTVASAETTNSLSEMDRTWTRPAFTKGDNSNLVNNLKAAAQAVISLAPEHIFGSDYETNPRCYYDLLVSSDNNTVLTGIAAYIVDAVMPSMSLPSKDDILSSGATVGAILAAVVREFAAYLTPEYNYDALIYADFGTTSADKVKTFVAGKDNNYWFDVILTMAVNIGFEYLRAFADMGEDSDEWAAFVAYSGYKVDGGAYTEADLKLTADVNYWEGMIDYVIDWALDKDFAWTWKMETLVEVDGLTVDMTTAQNPFLKLDKILFGIIPFDEILNIEPANGQAKFEHFLRDDLILGLINLEWAHLINTVQFPVTDANYFRSGNVLDQLASLLKRIVNSLLDKVGGGSFKLIPDAVKTFDDLANQTNIATLAKNLLGALPTAYNNGLLNPVLPILGFFLGWQTNPQKYADATVWTEFRDNNDYAFQYNINAGGNIDSAETKIKFMNNSAGMLEKHRDSSVTDHAYDIAIKSITSDAKLNTLTFDAGDGACSPWETLTINVGGKYQAEETVTVTIAYDFVGKDGKAIGGTQYTSVSFLISNQYEDSHADGRFSGDDDTDYTGIDQWKKYQFVEDIFEAVTSFEPQIFFNKPTIDLSGTKSKSWGSMAAPDYDQDCDGNKTYFDMNAVADEWFDYYQGQEGGWENSVSDGSPATGKLYKAAAGKTAEMEDQIPYGWFDMGRVAIAYGSDNKHWEIEYIHYNDYDIYDIYSENKMNGYNANQGVDSATYNEYNAAWKDIVKYATYPMMTEAAGHASTDYVATIQPYIPDAIERFEAAKEAYEKALAEADANASAGAAAALPGFVTELQAEIDNDFTNGKEINFQDYEYYEYFNYQDTKVAAENLYRSYLAPEIMDTYYIEGSGIREEELNYVIGNETNPFVKAALEASKMANDQEAIDASILAAEEWKMPVNTALYVEDFTSRLAYYKTFLSEDMMENNDHLYFLEKEIAHIEAQGLVEEDYESVTWGRYADALETAKAVAAGTDEFSEFNSRIYDVKYNLMVAYKQLLLKENSLFEKGNIADLRASIETANAIFASLEAADGVWALKEGVDANEAYAELLKALGYNYQAVYTKYDAEVKSGEKKAGDLKVNDDGTPMMFNLFADSALEYAENDRPNKQANQAKVDAANAALVAAMANFEKAVEDAPELGAIEGNTGAFGDVVVDEETGFTTGYIFGVTAGDAAEDYFALVNPDAGTVTWEESAEGATNGTGAVAVVKNTSGVEVARFTLVIFGDVNGDAQITANDYANVKDASLGATIDGEAYNMAADVNGDESITANDYANVKDASLGAEITVNPFVG